MPEALERKLKAQASKKDWSKERKDAYVYGTLRKTGWKPSHQKKEKKMASLEDRITRLHAMNEKIATVCFQTQMEEDAQQGQQRKQISPVKPALAAAGVGVGGAGALYSAGSLASKGAGGLGLTGRQMVANIGSQASRIGQGGLTEAARTIGTGAGVAYQTARKAASPMLAKIIARAKGVGATAVKALSARHEKLINLSKIIDEVAFDAWGPTFGPDPSAEQFGGNDPGLLAKDLAENKKLSALQRLRLKINKLKAMGLYSWEDPSGSIQLEDKKKLPNTLQITNRECVSLKAGAPAVRASILEQIKLAVPTSISKSGTGEVNSPLQRMSTARTGTKKEIEFQDEVPEKKSHLVRNVAVGAAGLAALSPAGRGLIRGAASRIGEGLRGGSKAFWSRPNVQRGISKGIIESREGTPVGSFLKKNVATGVQQEVKSPKKFYQSPFYGWYRE